MPRCGLEAGLPYVSRGGLKLAAALDAFGVDPAGWVCGDIGASTGGFTDCLLQRGAARVYAVDVGYGQLAWSLRQDPRVVSIERTNIRHLDPLPEPVRAWRPSTCRSSAWRWCCRVSSGCWRRAGQIIALDQAAVRGRQGPGGQGRRRARSDAAPVAIEKVLAAAPACGLTPSGVIRSPITGPAGNVEFLAWLKRGGTAPESATVEQWVRHAVEGTGSQEAGSDG